jgi:glycosyltransferase involved in cell wall biosynthesis
VLAQDELAAAYSGAGVGLVLSLTNYSLIAQEMMACGLPCVELETPSTRAAFGPRPPLELARPDPLALADALERLLSDGDLRAERRRAAIELVAKRTWAAAAEQVEAGLREALRVEEQ